MNKRDMQKRIEEIDRETTFLKSLLDKSIELKTKNKLTIQINKLIGEKFTLKTYLMPEKENAIKN